MYIYVDGWHFKRQKERKKTIRNTQVICSHCRSNENFHAVNSGDSAMEVTARYIEVVYQQRSVHVLYAYGGVYFGNRMP